MRIIDEKMKTIPGNHIAYVAQELKKGRIAILPTSTIYGISCIYNNKKTLEKVYDIKGRVKSEPFIILVSEISSVYGLVQSINSTARALIDKYWTSCNPVPLTLLFERKRSLDRYITSGSDRIAIRMDPLKIIKLIIDKTGPIISTSATISGERGISPKKISEVPEKIKKEVDIILDLEIELPGIASTIIDVTGSKPAIIREGIIGYEDIKGLLD